MHGIDRGTMRGILQIREEKVRETISPAHGSGGKLMNELINVTIREILGPQSIQLDDSAVLPVEGKELAFTTDSFTITPILFPGGNIGSLAINGTVNDLAVMGAVPKYISCALILEEGFDINTLKEILIAMKEAADYAGVSIVTGDTKVIQKGKADQIFINTSGIGFFKTRLQRRPIQKGDKIIINGTIGDHGIAIMAERNNLSFSDRLESDCAPMNHLIAHILKKYPDSIKFMRDATRGGVASVLNEITTRSEFSACLEEELLPVKNEVTGFCEILGIDPLYAANEGKIVIIAQPDHADGIVAAMHEIREGKQACIIGEITDEFPGKAYMRTYIGGTRILPLLIDEQLPRIC